MRLADVIASTYFTAQARSEAQPRRRMIYDVRQTTIYHYARRSRTPTRAAAHADRPCAPARPRGRARGDAAAGRAPRAARFFGNHVTSVVLDEPHDT